VQKVKAVTSNAASPEKAVLLFADFEFPIHGETGFDSDQLGSKSNSWLTLKVWK
jgi:hypothetical protein